MVTQLIEILKGHKVFLQTHDFPDPDALASAYGMKVLLSNFGIESVIVYKGEVEKISVRRMLFLFNIEVVSIENLPEMKPEDYIVTVDAQKYNSNITDFIGDEIACVDHHPTVKECDYKYKDVRICGACASIVTGYFEELGIPIDKNTATALLYGIKMDTDSFNRGVTKYDVERFATLSEVADMQTIVGLYNNTMELNDLQAYGEAIRNIKVYGKVGFAYIDFECQDPLIAMVSDFVLRLDVVEVSVIYTKRGGGYKFSVRSENPRINAGRLTKTALRNVGDGGGHAQMAGGIIFKDKVELLRDDHDNYIEKLFMDALEELR